MLIYGSDVWGVTKRGPTVVVDVVVVVVVDVVVIVIVVIIIIIISLSLSLLCQVSVKGIWGCISGEFVFVLVYRLSPDTGPRQSWDPEIRIAEVKVINYYYISTCFSQNDITWQFKLTIRTGNGRFDPVYSANSPEKICWGVWSRSFNQRAFYEIFTILPAPTWPSSRFRKFISLLFVFHGLLVHTGKQTHRRINYPNV